jgi:hypothetical protein
VAAKGALVALLLVIIVGCGSAEPTVSPAASRNLPAATPLASVVPTSAVELPTTAPSQPPTTAPATPSIIPSSIPTASLTASPAASQSATPPVSSPPASEPGSSTTPAPGGETGWVGPLQVSARHYQQISMVVDSDGHVHAAALLGREVWYVTDASGSWIRSLIDRPPSGTQDDSPQIAIDPADGSRAVVFSRRSTRFAPNFSGGGYLATNTDGTWSTPQVVLDSAEQPHVAARNGGLVFAFDDQEVPDAEDLNDVTRPLYQPGPDKPAIELAPIGVVLAIQARDDASAQVMFATWSPGQSQRAQIKVAHIDANDQVTTEQLPVPRSEGWSAKGAFGSSGDPIVNWETAKTGTLFAFVRDGSWTAPQDLSGYAAALDDGGNAHGFSYSLSETDGDSQVVTYFSNDGQRFSDLTDLLTTRGDYDAALALDAAGRAYMLIGAPAGLTYAVAPAAVEH